MSLSNIVNFNSIDDLCRLRSPIHRFHPSVKVIVSLIFIIIVTSFPPGEISALMPFFLYPVVITAVANIQLKKILKMILPALPFILLVAIFNPFFDRRTAIYFGNFILTHGMLSFLSIITRSFLTLSAVVLLVATTGIYNIAYVLQSFKIPAVFVSQLIFLHRYIFILAEEAITMKRAALSRLPYGKHPNVIVFGHMFSSLIARAFGKSAQIYSAMLARGFSGKIEMQKNASISAKDLIFALAWTVFFVMARLYDIPEFIGNALWETIK